MTGVLSDKITNVLALNKNILLPCPYRVDSLNHIQKLRIPYLKDNQIQVDVTGVVEEEIVANISIFQVLYALQRNERRLEVDIYK